MLGRPQPVEVADARRVKIKKASDAPEKAKAGMARSKRVEKI